MGKDFMSGVAWKSGLLTASPLVIPMAGAPLPATVTITGVGAAIEAATDGGTDYGVPETDLANGNMQAVFIFGNVTNIRLSGPIGSPWSIR